MKINSIPQRKSYLCLWVQIVKIRLSALSLHQTSGVYRSIKTKLNPDPDIRSGIAIHIRPKKNVKKKHHGTAKRVPKHNLQNKTETSK